MSFAAFFKRILFSLRENKHGQVSKPEQTSEGLSHVRKTPSNTLSGAEPKKNAEELEISRRISAARAVHRPQGETQTVNGELYETIVAHLETLSEEVDRLTGTGHENKLQDRRFPMAGTWLNRMKSDLSEIYKYGLPHVCLKVLRFGISVFKFPLGDSHYNNLLAIGFMKHALSRWPGEYQPDLHSLATYALGTMHAGKADGGSAEDQEEAIRYFNEALSMGIRDFDLWAAIMCEKARVYATRIHGDPSSNIECAIDDYTQALSVWGRRVNPIEWADIMYNLAALYSTRRHSDPSTNRKRVIEYCAQALLVEKEYFQYVKARRGNNDFQQVPIELLRGSRPSIPDSYPKFYDISGSLWGGYWDSRVALRTTCAALGKRYVLDKLERHILSVPMFYDERAFLRADDIWIEEFYMAGKHFAHLHAGVRSDNQERAIENLRRALYILKKPKYHHSHKRAKAMYALGNVYMKRIQGNRSENLEYAIEYFHQAMAVWHKASEPSKWARIMLSLGNVYAKRIVGGRSSNQELAVRYFKDALSIFTKDVNAHEWAMIMYNLGILYGDRILGDISTNQDKALRYFYKSLSIWTKEDAPLNWAATMHALGNVHRELSGGSPSKNIQHALRYYQYAAELITEDLDPELHIATQHAYGHSVLLLGRMQDDEKLIEQGLNTLLKNASTIESLRELCVVEEARKAFFYQYIGTYHALIDHFLKVGDNASALYWMERGRSRILMEGVNVKAADHQERNGDTAGRAYQELVEQIRALHYEIAQHREMLTGTDLPDTEEREAWRLPDTRSLRNKTDALIHMEKKRLTLLKRLRALRPTHRTLFEGELPEPVELARFLRNQRAGAVSLFVSGDTVHCLATYLEGNELQHHYLHLPGGFVVEKTEAWMTSSLLVGKMPYHLHALEDLLCSLGELLEPLCEFLENKGINRIFFIPHHFFHMLPLHAAKLPGTGKYLIELYEVSYIPTLGLAYRTSVSARNHRRLSAGNILALFCAPEGSSYLTYGEREIDALSTIYEANRITVLKHHRATVEGIVESIGNVDNEIEQLIFCCHGISSPNSEQTCLYLSDGTRYPPPHLCKGRLVTKQEILAYLHSYSPRLVILSACETGQSFEGLKGFEEYVGLDSVFMQMLVPAIVSTLYAVNDNSTADIMIHFHQEMASGRSPSEALRKAQLAFMNRPVETAQSVKRGRQEDKNRWPFTDRCHPYFWAFLKYSGLFV